MPRTRPRDRRVGPPFAQGFGDALSRIASNVRRLRAERGLTQEGLAELAELSTVGVAFVEGARTNVTTATLCQLAHALGVDVAVLVGRPGAATARKRVITGRLESAATTSTRPRVPTRRKSVGGKKKP